MPLVILHHLLNVSVQLANKSGFKQTKKKLVSESLLSNCCYIDAYFTATAKQQVYMPQYKTPNAQYELLHVQAEGGPCKKHNGISETTILKTLTAVHILQPSDPVISGTSVSSWW
jgi:hypothetical protein